MVNLSSFIRFHAPRTPNRLAIVYKDQRITYAALLERIELTAGWLAQRGIGAGDIVAAGFDRRGKAEFAPVMLTAVLGHSDRGQYDVSGLRWVIGGGERTPESRIREFSGYFAGGRYFGAYGLMEMGSGDTLMEAGRETRKNRVDRSHSRPCGNSDRR